ncbi:MAG: hypothetical protein UT02_C0001G0002 [Parcubacteria group bacterium GW2011_GWC2_38_7]|nr:MAG: hypothetical protein UT02_C0001G0002 [Parcubacteria group bacterium GW2011_GWC2_38_7]
MGKIKIGVIGTGHLGKLHVKMFKQIQECEVTGIYDGNSQTAKDVAQEFNVKAFDNLDDLLKNIQAASIAVSTTAHHEVAKKCLEKNIHIFVEKPITSSISEAEELVQISSKAGTIIAFNFAKTSASVHFSLLMFCSHSK